MSREFKECASCGCKTYGASMRCCDNPVEVKAPSYPDDVVAVMRDTIDSLREAIKAKDALIILLRHEVDETRRTLDEGTASLQLAQAIIAANQARLAGSPLPEGM